MPEKRTRRTPQELAQSYDEKIQRFREQIESLERKKEEVLNPKKRMTKAEKLEAVFQQAMRDKVSGEEAAEKLGIAFDEALANYKKPRKASAPAESAEVPAESPEE